MNSPKPKTQQRLRSSDLGMVTQMGISVIASQHGSLIRYLRHNNLHTENRFFYVTVKQVTYIWVPSWKKKERKQGLGIIHLENPVYSSIMAYSFSDACLTHCNVWKQAPILCSILYQWLSARLKVTPFLMHWHYYSLVLSHKYVTCSFFQS